MNKDDTITLEARKNLYISDSHLEKLLLEKDQQYFKPDEHDKDNT